MTGREYIQAIRAELMAGRHQHRMGENVLRAFGYVRRRATAINEINSALDDLELVADPPITSEMPLKAPRIRFSLKGLNGAEKSEAADKPSAQDSDDFNAQSQDISDDFNAQSQDIEDIDRNLPEPGFSVSELKSANCDVECVSPNASVQAAYTTMVLYKFSQLVVANNSRPRQQDIKGIVSFQSLAKALMNGNPKTVSDCIDDSVPRVQSAADLKSVVSQLSENDVVLVMGIDKRLQGIVTAWDLAEEFAELADPFKRIGEIEERLRALVRAC